MAIIMRYAMSILTLSLILALADSAPLIAAAPAPATTAPAAGAGGREVDPAVEAFLTPIDADGQDDALRQKLKAHHNTAVQLLKLQIDRYRSGVADASGVFETAREV